MSRSDDGENRQGHIGEDVVGRACLYREEYGMICRCDDVQGKHRFAVITQKADETLGVYTNLAACDLLVLAPGTKQEGLVMAAVREAMFGILRDVVL